MATLRSTALPFTLLRKKKKPLFDPLSDEQGSLLTGAAELASPLAITKTGTSRADRLIGTSSNDVLSGLGGNDLLDGRTGRDRMTGGTGNDTYIVDNTGDRVIEGSRGGTDLVKSSVNWTLGSQVENLTLTGSRGLKGTGNSLANTITGNTGHNILDGKAGADKLIGGKGNDTYTVDNAKDRVIETSNQGTDTVKASVSYTLSAHVEHLILTGSALHGTGNDLANRITGNALANRLDGAAGNDTLHAGAGNDTLIGGTGQDLLLGGAGDDTYIVDDAGDVIAEAEGGGTDTVRASLNYTLGAALEHLILTGTAMTGTGNSLDNAITGNELDNTLTGGDGNDTLDGGAGMDTLYGGAGDDTYIIDDENTLIYEQGGDTDYDTVRTTLRTHTLDAGIEALVMLDSSDKNFASGNELNNVITTGSSDDLLDGRGGADTLLGGAGNDTYVIDNAGDVAVELEDNGTDVVLSFINSYTLGDNLENLILIGPSALNGSGNALDNRLIGSNADNILEGLDGNDTLDGGSGLDQLRGGLGNDLYIINDFDTVAEAENAGTDTIESIMNFTLPANVEVLVLTGTANISGTGNEADNRIVGNSNENTLDGAGGADTLEGGNGDDTYIVDSLNDVIIDTSGTDLVKTSVNFGVFDFTNLFVPTSLQRSNPLKTEIENLELTGAASVGIGNTGNNYIRGNSGSDALDGLFGNDTLDGGEGDDVLFSSQASRTLFQFSGKFGTDVIHGFNSAKGDRIDLRLLRAPGQTQVLFDVYDVANPANTSQKLFRVDVYVTDPASGGPYTGKIFIVGANWTTEPQIMSMIWG
jgi:Ca2+-binding RTX toxin-like protein